MSDDPITLSSYPRAIVHVDCDAFFASCEQARDPSLKGKPVITGKERGIIAAASYEAKALGIKRGVSLRDAKKICPGLIMLPSDYETYSIYSERMFDIIRRFTPMVEEFSIDEAFCDITGLRRLYRASYPDIARRMKEEIRKELDITVSAGVSLTKTLAKIGSQRQKPDGLTAIPGYKIHEYLEDTGPEKVCGFGPNTVELLAKHGIKSVLDYVRRPVTFAQKLLGKIGVELWRELRGEAVYALVLEKKEKYLSISKTKTFSPASNDKETVKAQLLRNLESGCIKLRRHKLSSKRVTVYLKTSAYRGSALEARLNRHSSATLDFAGICVKLFDMLFKKSVTYRATGVFFGDIAPEGIDDRTLFDDPVRIKEVNDISRAIDEINDIYGKYAVHLAATGPAIKRPDSAHPRNDLAWRKQNLLKGETFRKRLDIPLLKF